MPSDETGNRDGTLSNWIPRDPGDAIGRLRAWAFDRGEAFAAVARRSLLPAVLASAAVLLVAAGSGAISAFGALAILSALVAAEVVRKALVPSSREVAVGSSRPDSSARVSTEAVRLIDAMPDPSILLDREGRVLHHNELAAERFPTVRRGSLLSRALRHAELLDAIERSSGSGTPATVSLVERVPVDNRLSASVRPIGARGVIGPGQAATLVTFRDLSYEDKLAKMREDFVANASHELRTPLSAVRGFVETLQGAARDDPVARERFLGLMAAQAERMTRLIDDLLSLSRAEMQAHLPPREIVDLDDLAASAVETMQGVAARAGATLLYDAPDGPAYVRGDRDQLVQVVLNLIQNSISHGGKAVSIRVSVERQKMPPGPARLLLKVRDNGPGIDPQHLPRLTERFYRANVAQSRAKGGTGLGLAIVKHIVARHRGELSIESDLGRGTTFGIAFEAADQDVK
ncbi:MAG: sensor histidine kinase [Hyphomicrobiaceae bacterium]